MSMGTRKENVSVHIQDERLLIPDNDMARVVARKLSVTEACP